MIFLVPWTSLKKLVIMVLDLTLIRSIISQKPLKFFALCRNHALCEKKKRNFVKISRTFSTLWLSFRAPNRHQQLVSRTVLIFLPIYFVWRHLRKTNHQPCWIKLVSSFFGTKKSGHFFRNLFFLGVVPREVLCNA